MPEKNENCIMLRLPDADLEKLRVAADDIGAKDAVLARLIVQNYLAGYQGPYVLRVPLADSEAGEAGEFWPWNDAAGEGL